MSGSGSLAGRTVLVTGGNGGIGLAMASAVGRAGARVVVWGRNETKNAVALERLEAEGITAWAMRCDVTDEVAVEAVFAEAVGLVGGRIDSVFANAATTGVGSALVETTLEEWRRVVAHNLDSVFLTARTAARHMVGEGGGAIVLISSTSAFHGAAGNDAYGACKAALLGLTRSMAVGLARHQIRVNALVPGWTLTDLAAGQHQNHRFLDATTRRTPVRRWADPDEMGPAAVFLADPSITFHTGDDVVVDGGYTVF